jgi:phosphomannomutase
MTLATAEKLYICPGESHPITRSVHLARLAAFYPACRNCPLRTDTGQLCGKTVERLARIRTRSERKTLFTDEGVRGVHLNELTRSKADELAAALAALLWEAAPLAARKDGSKRGIRPSRPMVVVGHDERSSSPDVVTGVVAGLRRTGCQVIDISLTTRPCFAFSVEHVQAQAGVFVTGNGCEPSWTGMDFAGAGGCPISRSPAEELSAELTLERLEERVAGTFYRPTRHAGSHRTFQAMVPYEGSLWKHFHALRPLKIACACPSRLVRQTLSRIFATLPCRLSSVEVPSRARNISDPDDADIARIGRAVREAKCDVGVLIDDDGSRVAFLDEAGDLVSARDVTRLVAAHLLIDHPGASLVLEGAAFSRLGAGFEHRGAASIDGGSSLAEMFRAMQSSGAIFGGGESGRYWFGESVPTCDAVLTTAKLLQALSRSDAAFSEVRARAMAGCGLDSLPVADFGSRAD